MFRLITERFSGGWLRFYLAHLENCGYTNTRHRSVKFGRYFTQAGLLNPGLRPTLQILLTRRLKLLHQIFPTRIRELVLLQKRADGGLEFVFAEVELGL